MKEVLYDEYYFTRESISFKEFEQKIFASVCELAKNLTTEALTKYDDELAKRRNRNANTL